MPYQSRRRFNGSRGAAATPPLCVLALQRRCWHDPINHGLADRDPAVFMPAFIIFLIGYVLSQFYRSFLAVIAPELSAELHLTPQDLGNILACWFAAFAVVQFPVGAALDKHGPRRTLHR